MPQIACPNCKHKFKYKGVNAHLSKTAPLGDEVVIADVGVTVTETDLRTMTTVKLEDDTVLTQVGSTGDFKDNYGNIYDRGYSLGNDTYTKR